MSAEGKDPFVFFLGQGVLIESKGTVGGVIGRCQYLTSESQYLVKFKDESGKEVEGWWGEASLKHYSAEMPF